MTFGPAESERSPFTRGKMTPSAQSVTNASYIPAELWGWGEEYVIFSPKGEGLVSEQPQRAIRMN